MDDARKKIIQLCEQTGTSRRKVASYLGVQSSNLSNALRGLPTIADADLESAVEWLEGIKAKQPAVDPLAEFAVVRSPSLDPALAKLKEASERNAPIATQCACLTTLALETIANALAGAKVPGSSMKAAEMVLAFAYGKPKTTDQGNEEKPPAADTLRDVLRKFVGEPPTDGGEST